MSLSGLRSLPKHQPTAIVLSALSTKGCVTYILPYKGQSIDKERSITLKVNEAKCYSNSSVTLNIRQGCLWEPSPKFYNSPFTSRVCFLSFLFSSLESH